MIACVYACNSTHGFLLLLLPPFFHHWFLLARDRKTQHPCIQNPFFSPVAFLEIEIHVLFQPPFGNCTRKYNVIRLTTQHRENRFTNQDFIAVIGSVGEAEGPRFTSQSFVVVMWSVGEAIESFTEERRILSRLFICFFLCAHIIPSKIVGLLRVLG